MDYKLERIKLILSRMPFIDRIALIEYLSFLSIFPLNKVLSRKREDGNYIFPWTAETIATIALLYPHESSNSNKTLFQSKECSGSIKQILKIIDKSGVSYINTKVYEKYGHDVIIRALTIQQERYQESVLPKMFRYKFVFSYNEITKHLFERKTGVGDYDSFGVLSLLPSVLKRSVEKENEAFAFYCYQKWLRSLLSSMDDCLDILCIELDDFIKQQNEKINNQTLDEISSSYKVMYEKPILKHDNQYMILSSHCLEYACTDGLFINITYKESEIIKQALAKALEDYLYYIADESGACETVPLHLRKKQYGPKKRRHDPSDVVIKNADSLVMFEVKTFIHQRKLWINDCVALDNEYDKAVQATKELLANYHAFIDGVYSPFSKDDREKKVFLVLVMLTFANFNLDYIINDVIKDERFATDEAFLRKSLVITDMHSIEIYFLYKKDIIKDLFDYSDCNKLQEFGSRRMTCRPDKRIKPYDDYLVKIIKDAETHVIKMSKDKQNN